VVACVAGDAKGNIFNVNADQMAVACAVSFRADVLHFLTDVDGVRDQTGEIRSTLTAVEARDLVTQGIATGGMQAKLESALEALKMGVSEIRIAPGIRPGIIAQLMNGSGVGTRLTAS